MAGLWLILPACLALPACLHNPPSLQIFRVHLAKIKLDKPVEYYSGALS